MKKPIVHLICNAHLDPVWQWRWEEGCSEALSTFNTAVTMLEEYPSLIFNHNEAILYEWTLRYDKPLFKEIQRLVRKKKWHIAGGWFLQPDVNIPGTESIIRQILFGRKFFAEHFKSTPKVAYNFDSFGHTGGLPQILRLAGYSMYIHMRPQTPELQLPSDLYRWKGIEGSEILTYRIAVGLYHTERHNIEQRLAEGVELALRLNRDVPVFWGIGDHGGGATREDMEKIEMFQKKEPRVQIIHSTTGNFHYAVRRFEKSAPVFEGDLQRVFTGCYTSLARLKRSSQKSLADVFQAETISAAVWWQNKEKYPANELNQLWKDHLFNDFHDILPGSCTEPAESDALGLYAKTDESVRRLKIRAAAVYNRGEKNSTYIPLTILNTNPSLTTVPVEAECMLDLRPKWSGKWFLRLFDTKGNKIDSQEEQPESLLPFNGWRRKIAFNASLPAIGAEKFELRIIEGQQEQAPCIPALQHSIDSQSGFLTQIDAGGGRKCLSRQAFVPLVVDDDGDAWGSDRWHFRNVLGSFHPQTEKNVIVENGPIRKITESVLHFSHSKIVMRIISYSALPLIECRLRVHWNEERKRLKLSIPTIFHSDHFQCEIPGGIISRPADGEEYVHGRWSMLSGTMNGKETAIALIHSGQHGIDVKEGEIRLSLLRSAAYCHEQGFPLGETPARKYMDQGVHEIRLAVTAGDTNSVLPMLNGFSEWLTSPPSVYSHMPVSSSSSESLISISHPGIRLLACKQAENGKGIIVRLQELTGTAVSGTIGMSGIKKNITVHFKPFEIITLRFEKNGRPRRTGILE